MRHKSLWNAIAPIAMCLSLAAAPGGATSSAASDGRYVALAGSGVECDTVIAGHGVGGVCFEPGEVPSNQFGQTTITVTDDVAEMDFRPVSAFYCPDAQGDGRCDVDPWTGASIHPFCQEVTVTLPNPAGGLIVGVDFVPFGIPLVTSACGSIVTAPTVGTVSLSV